MDCAQSHKESKTMDSRLIAPREGKTSGLSLDAPWYIKHVEFKSHDLWPRSLYINKMLGLSTMHYIDDILTIKANNVL